MTLSDKLNLIREELWLMQNATHFDSRVNAFIGAARDILLSASCTAEAQEINIESVEEVTNNED